MAEEPRFAEPVADADDEGARRRTELSLLAEHLTEILERDSVPRPAPLWLSRGARAADQHLDTGDRGRLERLLERVRTELAGLESVED